MKKIGFSLLTLLAVATSACTGSPTASAAGADASMNGVFGGSVNFSEEGPGLAGSGHVAGVAADAVTTDEADRNPGLGMTGH